jgi:hypothetical protein
MSIQFQQGLRLENVLKWQNENFLPKTRAIQDDLLAKDKFLSLNF